MPRASRHRTEHARDKDADGVSKEDLKELRVVIGDRDVPAVAVKRMLYPAKSAQLHIRAVRCAGKHEKLGINDKAINLRVTERA